MVNFTNMLLGKESLSKRLHKERLKLLVVWNITRRCNLYCKHCYASSTIKPSPSELSTQEAKNLIDGLAELGVGVLLFSGGEPLLREDLLEIIEHAHARNIRCAISTNGTLITQKIAHSLKEAGIIYVGVSIDGDRETHNQLRGKGCFEAALEGLRICQQVGIPVGVRFTINKLNYHSLDDVLSFVMKEKIPRFCMYHLVYTGRADKEMDIDNKERRKVIDYLIRTAREVSSEDVEILTVDNPCDGVYLYKKIVNDSPHRKDELLKELMFGHGRCSAGEKILSISPEGDVGACQFWRHQSLGNVRKEHIKEIWNNNYRCNLLQNKSDYLKGKCGICNYKQVCGGCRLRAKEVYGDLWAQDPSCYLTQKEVSDGVSLPASTTVTEEW